MLKFDFTVKTRDGQKIDSIQIQGKDKQDAERKLFQMYRYCEVLNCRTIDLSHKLSHTTDIEELLSLIAKHN